MDINPLSYRLTAFELINPVLVFQDLNAKFFWKDLKTTLPSSIAV